MGSQQSQSRSQLRYLFEGSSSKQINLALTSSTPSTNQVLVQPFTMETPSEAFHLQVQETSPINLGGYQGQDQGHLFMSFHD